MAEFWRAVTDPSTAFLRYALIAGLMASVAFGVLGTYVVARRISYVAGGIAHCVLGGIGAAIYLQKEAGMPWMREMYGGLAAAIVAALVIGLVSLYARQREDTVIGAVWAVGMAVGLLFLHKTSGYVDPMAYLFGDILMISRADLLRIALLDAVVLGVTALFYGKFLAVCFDEEFARMRGVRVEVYYLLLLCLTAVAVVLLARLVGIVLVIALLTLPAAVAGQLSRRLWQMMALAVLFCMAFTGIGLGISYEYNLYSGPTIIVLAGAAFLGFAVARRLAGKRA